MRYLAKGEHELQIQAVPGLKVQSMSVKAIPELIHCGLGFNSAIKSYGLYDMQFLKKDILPNITTLIVPQNIELPKDVIDAWHVQGKKFVAEVGINGQALNEPYLRDANETTGVEATRIPTNHYWVMGDNRTNSKDSRSFGAIPDRLIVGRAFVRLWPISHIHLL